MNLQYSYSTAKRTRDFFEMIVRYINVLLLPVLLLLVVVVVAIVESMSKLLFVTKKSLANKLCVTLQIKHLHTC